MPAERTTYAYKGSARIFRWYDLADDDRFRCPCGWEGSFSEMSNEGFEELVDGSCPKCDTMLGIRSFPTRADLRAAAARGNAEAAKELWALEDATKELRLSP